jgi:hypothetical protein
MVLFWIIGILIVGFLLLPVILGFSFLVGVVNNPVFIYGLTVLILWWIGTKIGVIPSFGKGRRKK